uniref:Putative secreted protein n=1 Tax=Ixodes ricinus TaxID=34613 RepID=A0A6B0U377_IXORI
MYGFFFLQLRVIIIIIVAFLLLCSFAIAVMDLHLSSRSRLGESCFRTTLAWTSLPHLFFRRHDVSLRSAEST